MSLTIDIDDEAREILRIVADSIARDLPVDEALRSNGLDPTIAAQVIGDVVSDEDDCPECPRGTVVPVGRPESDTGHQSYACDAGCGYRG